MIEMLRMQSFIKTWQFWVADCTLETNISLHVSLCLSVERQENIKQSSLS